MEVKPEYFTLIDVLSLAWPTLEDHMTEINRKQFGHLNPDYISEKFMRTDVSVFDEALLEMPSLVSYATLLLTQFECDKGLYSLIGEYGKYSNQELSLLEEGVGRFPEAATVHYAYAQVLFGYSFSEPERAWQLCQNAIVHFECAANLNGYLAQRVEDYKGRIKNIIAQEPANDL